MSKNTRVFVTIKPDVLDPAGSAVHKVLNRQGIFGVKEVRIGKVIDITFNQELAGADGAVMFEQLKGILCNPIIEDCQIESVDEL
jgi:phosphoribosylformylglycinamidine synthase subunit PurS